MPTIFSHAAVPLAIGLGLGQNTVSRRLLLAGVFAAMIPDADVLGFRFHIAYADTFGHRGATHSLMFAMLLGALAFAAARHLKVERGLAFCFVTASAASHGLLDMLTDGGLGVAFFWPFTGQRFFLPWRPIEVSPFGLHLFSNEHGADVLFSELLWVWLPALAAALGIVLLRGRFAESPRAIE